MEAARIFLITYFAALLAVVAPGLVNMIVARTSLKYGKKNGVYMALGASCVVLFQAAVAILLAHYIFDNPFVKNILLRAGLVIFLMMMVYFLVMAHRKKRRLVEASPVSGIRSVVQGAIIAALNVFPLVFFVALGAALNVNGNLEYYLLDNLAFVFGASLGTFTTLYLYALFFGKIGAEESFFAKYSNYLMAGLMLILVIITFIRIYTE